MLKIFENMRCGVNKRMILAEKVDEMIAWENGYKRLMIFIRPM